MGARVPVVVVVVVVVLAVLEGDKNAGVRLVDSAAYREIYPAKSVAARPRGGRWVINK